MLVELWETSGPLQPFTFREAWKIGSAEFEQAEVANWEAGDVVEVKGTKYVVSREILPHRGQVTLNLGWE